MSLFVVVDFTVHVFPDLTINHWLSLYGHAVPQASSSVVKYPKVLSCDSKLDANSSFSIHAVKWPASQNAYAKYAFATCNDDVQTFLIIAGKVGKISYRSKNLLRYLQKQATPGLQNPRSWLRLARLAWHFMKSNWLSPRRGKYVYRVTENSIDFVNDLGATVVIIFHEQNIRYPGQWHRGHLSSTTPGFPGVRTLVEGHRAVPSRMMQIVTSALRGCLCMHCLLA